MPDDRVSTAIRLDRDTHERLAKQAERRDVSVNWLITKAVERALPAWEEQDLG
jgi:predicted HicB family RNase H-like nuclease